MRQFSHKGLRIDQLSPEAKLVYSGFGVFALAAILISVVLYADMFDGGDAAEVGRYYAGESAPAGVDGDSAAGGPDIELPDDIDPGAPIIVKASTRKLLEVTHFHLFTVPIFLLVISHLFMLCVLRPRVKQAIVATASVSTALHLAAPWLVRALGPGAAALMPVTGTVMGATMTLMTVWPMVTMWRTPPSKNRRADT